MLFTRANTLALTLSNYGFIIGITASVGDSKDLKGHRNTKKFSYVMRSTNIFIVLDTFRGIHTYVHTYILYLCFNLREIELMASPYALEY